MAKWINVAKLNTRAEAEMVCELLLNEGVRAEAKIDDAGGFHPAIAFGLGTARVNVHPDDEEKAREILRATTTEYDPEA